MAQKMLTVGIPVYTTHVFLAAALNSLVAQHRKPDEVIIVDDGSPHDIEKAIRPWHDKLNILFIKHAENLGTCAARATMLEHAQGEYFLQLDSDDTLTPDCIENVLATAQAQDLDFVFGRLCVTRSTELLHEQPVKVGTAQPIEDFCLEGHEVLVCVGPMKLKTVPKMFHWTPFAVGGKLLRTSLARAAQANLPKDHCVHGEDTCLVIMFLALAGRGSLIKQEIYNYNLHAQSVSVDESRRLKRLNDVLKCLANLECFIDEQVDPNAAWIPVITALIGFFECRHFRRYFGDLDCFGVDFAACHADLPVAYRGSFRRAKITATMYRKLSARRKKINKLNEKLKPTNRWLRLIRRRSR